MTIDPDSSVDFRTRLAKVDADGLLRTSGRVFLLHGDEYLCREALDALLERVFTASGVERDCDMLDGATTPLSTALERVNTYSLLGGPKVVVLMDPALLRPRQAAAAGMQKAREAFAAGDLNKAGRSLRLQMADTGLTAADLQGPEPERALERLSSDERDWPWVLSLVAQWAAAAEDGPPDIPDPAALLEDALSRGFAAGHHLVLMSGAVDRRAKLYRRMEEKGIVADLTLPQGERRAERNALYAVLRQRADEILARTGQRIEPRAFQALCDLAGHDVRAFTVELEKLADYAGQRQVLKSEDVAALVRKTRSDPIYELTGAVAERDAAAALRVLTALLRDQPEGALHPLQVLSALANQMRRLLLAADCMAGEAGRAWRPGLSYGEFQSRVLPLLQRYDEQTLALCREWAPPGDGGDPLAAPAKGTKKKKKVAAATSDALVVRNPGNSYPIYLLMRHAEKFDLAEFGSIFQHLGRTERKLKGGGPPPELTLSELILFLCRPGGDEWRARETPVRPPSTRR